MYVQSQALLELADIDGAVALQVELLETLAESGQRRQIAVLLADIAAAAALRGLVARAVALLGASGALREQIGGLMSPTEREGFERRVSVLRASAGNAFEQAFAQGKRWNFDEAIYAAREVLQSLASAQNTPRENAR